MRGFWSYYVGVLLRPTATFRELMAYERKLKLGVLALLVPALGYTLFYILAWNAGGGPSTFKPWLAIPRESYYYWDIFLSIPAYLVSMLMATSVLYLLAKHFGGAGSWDDTFLMIAFAVGVATLSTMLHDLTDAFLGVTGVIDLKNYERLLNEPTFWRSMLWGLFMIYFAWFIMLFSRGLKETHKLTWLQSIIIGIIGLAVFQVMLLVFIR
ncbi:MAG TPA: YIP1 family protein [Bacteroidales bacterium]|nr:YIP1 family protein [Bacteroidales bacterium]